MHTIVILWMVRPTINHLEFMFDCNVSDDQAVLSNLRAIARDTSRTRRPDQGLSFSRIQTKSGVSTYSVSGELTPYLMPSPEGSNSAIRISVAATGGSLIMASLLDGSDNNRVQMPISVNGH